MDAIGTHDANVDVCIVRQTSINLNLYLDLPAQEVEDDIFARQPGRSPNGRKVEC